MILTANLQPGRCVRLSHFGRTPTSYKRRLIAMGLLPGKEVTLIRTAPLGCPLYFQIADTIIALRKNEAAQLCWEEQ